MSLATGTHLGPYELLAPLGARVMDELGRQDEAIDRRDFLHSHATDLSVHALRLDPIWDRLRANPRFQTLLVKHGGQA